MQAVLDIAQDEGCALLAVLFNQNAGAAGAGDFADFIAAD